MRKPYQLRPVPRMPSSVKPSKCPKPGVCTHCGKQAAKEALFHDGKATIIEKYCEDCLETEKFSALMTIYSRIG